MEALTTYTVPRPPLLTIPYASLAPFSKCINQASQLVAFYSFPEGLKKPLKEHNAVIQVSAPNLCWQPLAARLGTWSWHRTCIAASLARTHLQQFCYHRSHTPTETY